MGIDLTTMHVDVGSIGSVGPIGVPQPFVTSISGPLDTTVTINSPLPVIHLSIDSLPRIELADVNLNMRIKELPSIRGHIPADFCVGLSVFGIEIASIRLCGEAQLITEPYRPNPCETCEPEPAVVPGRVALHREP